MKFRKLGNSDLELPIITLGALNFGFFCDEEKSIETIKAAVDNGVNCIDTAPTYGGMTVSYTHLTLPTILLV